MGKFFIKFTTIFGIAAILCVFGFVSLYFVLTEKHYNSILMEYVSGEVCKDCKSLEEKVRTLRTFVHDNVHPVHGEHNRLDTVGIEKLVSGIGWCDQTSRVFMQLAKKRGITTRLLFLLNEDGSSPHSVCEIWTGKRWILVDAANNVEFINKDGKMASMSDIKEDFDIVLKNGKVKIFAKYNSYWEDKEYLSMYYRKPTYIVTKDGTKVRVFDYMPNFMKAFIVRVVQEVYIMKKKNEFTENNSFLYFRARSYHLTGRIKEAKYLYSKILSAPDVRGFLDKTRFYLALLLRDQNKLEESIDVLSYLIKESDNSNWQPYAYGLQSEIYRIAGNNEEAVRHYDKFAYSADAYF